MDNRRKGADGVSSSSIFTRNILDKKTVNLSLCSADVVSGTKLIDKIYTLHV